MPVINVDGPRISDIDKKRSFVKEITDAAVKVYGMPHETVIILINENLPENVGVGGQLISDRQKA